MAALRSSRLPGVYLHWRDDCRHVNSDAQPSIRQSRVVNPAAQRPSIHQSVNPSIRGSSIQPSGCQSAMGTCVPSSSAITLYRPEK